MKQKTCSNCKHVIIGSSNPECEYSDYLFRCRKCVLSTNYITGETVYGTCNTKNWSGECKDFEVQRTMFEEFLSKLKSIFNKC